MRKIKFRGKKVDNGEWVYGYYVFTHDRHRIIYEDYEGFYCEDEVIPETVGQYTGLKDENGNEIYEGDIVKFINCIDNIFHEEVGICVFEQDECNFVLQRVQYNHENYPVPTTIHTFYLISNLTYKDDVSYEVIGNIFDNPELLESEVEE